MKLKKIFKLSSWILFGGIFLSLILTVVINTLNLKNNQISSFFGYTISYVPTESMKPTIDPGDTVLIKRTEFDDIKLGDIIVYNDGSKYIIHRVVEINGDGTISTKGDNEYTNPVIDSVKVTKENFYGTYQKTVNFLNLSSIIRNRNYIFPLCILVFLIILISEGINLAGAIKSSNKKKLEEYSKELEKEKLLRLKEEALKELLQEIKEKK